MTLPEAIGLAVKARCPDCDGAVSVFDYKDSSSEFGFIIKGHTHKYKGVNYTRFQYRLLRCSGCGRAGLAKFHDTGQAATALACFYPNAVATAPLPEGVPEGVAKEYREAELCTSIHAFRAASALTRSVLEKTLKANGYVSGSLKDRIDQAAADGVITVARSKRAHDNIRVLGNDVVHEEWREVTDEEVETSLHFAQRVLEDLYDDRPTVEAVLTSKGRLPSKHSGP